MIEFGKYAAYALYRLPFRDEVHIVCQHSQKGTVCMAPELVDEDCRAFVMLPFDGSAHPVVRIRPDDEMTIKTAMLKIAGGGRISEVEENEGAYREVFERFHRAIPSQFEKLVLSRSVSARYDGCPMPMTETPSVRSDWGQARCGCFSYPEWQYGIHRQCASHKRFCRQLTSRE